MTAQINENTQYTDPDTGELLNNGFVYIGLNNLDAKLNPATIYSDRELTTVILNPQRTGSDGRVVNKIWIDGKYSLKVEDSAGVQKLNDLSLGELTQTNNTTLTNVQGIDSLTADGSPAVTSLVNNQVYIFTAANTNTGAVTLTIDLTPTWPIKKHHDLAMDAGDIEVNQTLAVIWNETDSVYELMTNSAIGPVNLAGNQTIAGDKTLTGTTELSGTTTLSGITEISGKTTLSGVITGASPLVFEGATEDAFETTLTVIDPTADNILKVPDTTDTLAVNSDISKIESITATVAASALTVGMNPTTLNFRSATLASGTPVVRAVSSAITMVVPDTATLESVNAQVTRLYVLAIDNAGTVELAVVNAAGGVNLNEEGLISTTAISTGSDSNDVIYSTTARSNVAYRVVGMVEYTQATAGTYATAPSLIQGMGGNALTSMSSLGYGQTYQDLTASRAGGTTYYNTTGRPITCIVGGTSAAGAARVLSVSINGGASITFALTFSPSGGSNACGDFVVPPGSSYNVALGGTTLDKWWELR